MRAIAVGLLVAGFSVLVAACKDDECRNAEYMTVENPVTGQTETRQAAWCSGTMVCNDKVAAIPNFKAAYTGTTGPCSRAFLRQFEGDALPSNCRDLKLTVTPICLEGSGATGAGPGGPILLPPGGATSGGDFPHGNPEGAIDADGIADEANWIEVDDSTAKEAADDFKNWYRTEFGIDIS